MVNNPPVGTTLLNKHADSFLRLEDLGTKFPRYRPTFFFPGEFINESHRFFSICPVDGALIQIKDRHWFGQPIAGWLRREDALKLYELAYFASGDVLELGSYHGLSTSILSQANEDSPLTNTIYSVDRDPACVQMTYRNVRRKGLGISVRTLCGDASTLVRRMASEGRSFEFVFVDHSHAYDPVYNVCRELGNLIGLGGFCLFHDFNDLRNADGENKDYGVYQAVRDGLSSSAFEFYGIYGCTGLYRRV